MDPKKAAEILQHIDATVLKMNHKALDVYLKLLFKMGVKNIQVDVRPIFP
jgi:hypothetical protein